MLGSLGKLQNDKKQAVMQAGLGLEWIGSNPKQVYCFPGDELLSHPAFVVKETHAC